MKRSLNEQQDSLNSSGVGGSYTSSLNLTVDSFPSSTSNHGPVSVSHASGLAYSAKPSPARTNLGRSTYVPSSSDIKSEQSAKFKSEVSRANVETVLSIADSMQSSVQSFPPQMQTTYQLPSVPISNHNASPTSVHQSVGSTANTPSAGRQPSQPEHQAHQVQAHHVTPTAAPAQVPSGAAAAGASAQQQQFQRLKVEDALSYLDKVKYKFGNQPQVYNDFLDIMKEFKSQSIDTPGVISRVSNLFKGHPELIVGFNTFLPPGYKIEVQSNEQVNVSMPGSCTPTILHPGNPTPNQQQQQQQNTSFYAAVDAEVVKRLMTFQAPNAPTVHSSSTAATTTSERASGNNSASGPTSASASAATSQHSYHQQQQSSAAPLSPLSTTNHSSAAVAASVQQQSANSQTSSQNQPVEFNHAIMYVNKIKNRFHGQPEIYKQFLEILHTYQKEQRNLKEGITPSNKPLTESEVYSQVAKLFQNQEDLLEEFGQFLPDANGAVAAVAIPSAKAIANDHSSAVKKVSSFNKTSNSSNNTANHHQTSRPSQQIKRPSSLSQLQNKKPRLSTQKDVSLAEASKHGTLHEYAYFDKVRKALRSPDVYDNFLRCLILFNQEVISRGELIQLVTPFLGKFPELFKCFKDLIGYKETSTPTIEAIPNRIASQERVGGDLEIEVDYSSCKRYGASYRALPKSYFQPKCSGRTALCKEVLNDTLVSFPSWSEDSTFVSSRKTQYEEYIYRCEDERFELDVVLETNLATIKVLEGVQKKINRMSADEASKFRLDDYLGSTSQFIHQRSIRRIYGDKAHDIIEGLKRNPAHGVSIVLKRLKAKEEEWRDAQKGFNKLWREQNEKYYLKSLDHQGITFKQNDIRNLRSKNFLNEIEMLYDERHEQMDEGSNGGGSSTTSGAPHLTLEYKDKSMLDDAANLIIHHVKRLTGVHKEDKQKMKQIVRQTIPDMFFHPRQELSDDEGDKEEDMDADDMSSNDGNKSMPSTRQSKRNWSKSSTDCSTVNGQINDLDKNQNNKPKSLYPSDSDEAYNLMFMNNNWYLFLRLHHILCERLAKMYSHAVGLAQQEAREKAERKEATSRALRLQPKAEYEVEEYYPALLDMVKSVLDGNLDNTQFEDTLRDMFGIHAYIAFSLDKVVTNIVRQLQQLASDDLCIQCTDLYAQEAKSGGAGGLCASAIQRSNHEIAYQRKAEQKMSGENCYKIYTYKIECKVAIELLDTDSDGSEDPVEVEKWSEYVEKYTGDECVSDELKEQLSKKPVFLPRNVRTWRLRAKKENLNKRMAAAVAAASAADKSSSGGDDDLALLSVDDLDVVNNMQCKFNLNSFKMVFVVNSESYLYKHMALQRASASHKKVSNKLNGKFKAWHQQWMDKHLSDNQIKQSNDWMMGKIDGQVPNVTICSNDNDLNKAPYVPYNRYKVQVPTTTSSTTMATATTAANTTAS